MLRVRHLGVRGIVLTGAIAMCAAPSPFMQGSTVHGDGPGQTACISWEFLENCCDAVTDPGGNNIRVRCDGTWCYGTPAALQPFATVKLMQSPWQAGPAWRLDTACEEPIRCMYHPPRCAGPGAPQPCAINFLLTETLYCGSGCANPPAPGCP